jgi:putative acetyltransferase
MAEVVTYRPEWRDEFARLNREWIEAWFVLEEADLETFRDPETKVLGPGGEIFFVVEDGAVMGTCAVLRHSAEVHEIAKMAVSAAARGRGYGDLLMDAALAFSRAAGAAKVIIVSNTRLGPAIQLYRKHGFVRVPLDAADRRYARADIRLEREIGAEGR